MKRTLTVVLFAMLIASCSSNAPKIEADAEKKADSVVAPVENIDYAYRPAYHEPDNWDRGDQKNVALVLKSLKAFEQGKVDEAVAAFADSIELAFEGMQGKVTRDSAAKMFAQQWKNTKSITIKMSDYESVTSKDKKENYVSLWYKEIWTDTKGKTDSAVRMDDVRVDNGKIASIDQKSRSFKGVKK
jgi:uncharacterized protein YcfL